MYCRGAQWPIYGSVRLELKSRGRWFEPLKKHTMHYVVPLSKTTYPLHYAGSTRETSRYGRKTVGWDVKHQPSPQTDKTFTFFLSETDTRIVHNEYIDWAVKPQLQTNIDTFVNQIMYVIHQ